MAALLLPCGLLAVVWLLFPTRPAVGERGLGAHGERIPTLTRHQWRAQAWHTDHIAWPQSLGSSSLHAMLEESDGSLWIGGERINGREGIVRIAASEWRMADRDPRHSIATTVLHEGDCVGPALSGVTSASAAKDRDGTGVV